MAFRPEVEELGTPSVPLALPVRELFAIHGTGRASGTQNRPRMRFLNCDASGTQNRPPTRFFNCDASVPLALPVQELLAIHGTGR